MKTRKPYFDILRIIAIFFVLYTHTDQLAVHHYMIEGGKVSYWVSYALQQFTYICNVTFFFVSGALLLGKKEDLRTLFSKRVLKYLLIIIVFGFLQYCHNYYHDPAIGFDPEIIAKLLYSQNIITPYWFLHAYLAYVLILPFLRVLAEHMPDTLGKYLVGGCVFINGILPLVEELWENERIALSIPLFEMMILYPLLGYFLETRWYSELVKGWRLLVMNCLGILAWALDIWYSYHRMQRGYPYCTAGGLTLILVVVLYLDIRFLCEKYGAHRAARANVSAKRIGSKILAVVGKSTFITYLLNNVLSEQFEFLYHDLVLRISWLGATIVWLGTVILAGAAISLLYETVKLPFKKLIRRHA